MTQMKRQLEYQTWQLTQSFLVVAGVSTAVYRTPYQASRPTWLLLHGISGDHHGLMPLGYELRHAVNIVVVELPGHGLSDIPGDTSIEWLQKWSIDLLLVCQKEKIIFDRMIAHSFSCLLIAMMLEVYDGPVVFINAVAHPAWFYIIYAHVISYFRGILARCINFIPFSFLRGVWLLQFYNKETIAIVYWLAVHTVCSPAQARYQMYLSNQLRRIDMLSKKKLQDVKHLKILCGKQDNFSATSPDQLHMHLPNAAMTVHDGGHLLPIERAAYIAKVLLK